MRQTIWSTNLILDETARKENEEILRHYYEKEGYRLSDSRWAEIADDYLDIEREALDIPVDGVIIAFADLGLWRGRRQGYKILSSTISDIFSISEDDNEWYGDGYNIRGQLSHHDGTHNVLYRVAKNREVAERIAEQIYNLEIDEAGFRRRTRSLYPYVASIYGWNAGRFTKSKK